MKFIESVIATVSPGWAAKRAQARHTLSVFNSYEAIKTTRLRNRRGDSKSGDATAHEAVKTIREISRDLDQNHDLAHGALNILVNCTIGQSGIGVEPMVMDTGGNLLTDLNEEIHYWYMKWSEAPDVTKELDRAMMERLAGRSLYRDGEFFAQHVEGNVNRFNHGSPVSYSLELLESDMVPENMFDPKKRLSSGIERNSWGEPRFFNVLKQHPGDILSDSMNYSMRFDTKRISAERMTHVKLIDRIRQGRGISVFASVYTRLDDLRDFEESERIAARIAAAQVMAITKPLDGAASYLGDDSSNDRSFDIAPGSIWDDLLPGEKPEILSSDRPNNNLDSFRMGQLKAVSSGVGVNYSSLAKEYSVSYSSQRQELAEQYGSYGSMTALFISKFTMPNYKRFMRMLLTQGLITLPDNVDMNSLYAAQFIGPVAPWIDPQKEAKADELLLKNNLASHSQLIRRRGGIPRDTFKQIQQDNDYLDNSGNTQNTNDNSTGSQTTGDQNQ